MRGFAPLIAAFLLAGPGCGGEPLEPMLEVEVGFLHEGDYRPLLEGGECEVVAAQAGYWVMPTVRVWGAPADASVGCALRDFDLGLELGQTVQEDVLEEGAGDFQEVAPLSVYLAGVDGENFLELEGHQGELDCFARAGDAEARAVIEVQLATRTLF